MGFENTAWGPHAFITLLWNLAELIVMQCWLRDYHLGELQANTCVKCDGMTALFHVQWGCIDHATVL